MSQIAQVNSKTRTVPLIVCLVISMGLWGCTTAPNYSSPFTTPNVGSTIQLNQEISARNGVRIYVQDGYVLSWMELEKLEPYCQFYVARSRDDLRSRLTIQPDTFVVDRVFRRKDISRLKVPSPTLAEVDLPDPRGIQLAMGEGDTETDRGSSQRTMSTYMELSSATQPHVKRMICSQWADPSIRYHVSVEEIIRSLGDLAEFTPQG